MPSTKRKKPSSKTNAVSSVEPQMDRSMNYWLEKIKPEDMAWLWRTLKDSAKVATPHTLLVRLENGITFKGVFLEDAIVSTTPGGFVLFFTVKDIGK